MSKHEKDLWRAVVDSVDPGVAGYYDDRITYLCTRFREFEPISVRRPPFPRPRVVGCHCPICSQCDIVCWQAEILHQCFDPDATVEVPEIARCQNCMFQFAEMLTC